MITEAYITVYSDNLRNFNDETKKIWEKAVKDDKIFSIKNGNGYKILDEVYFNLKDEVYFNLKSECNKTMDGADPYGIPNVNFTLIDQNDNRWEEYKKQRIERGFDDSELWSLDVTISKFILPRLKAFKDIAGGYPGGMTAEYWEQTLDHMIEAFELQAECKFSHTKEEEKKIEDGLKLFTNYFGHLWY